MELNAAKSDDQLDFVPKKITNNYRTLLDSDSEEDENSTKPQKQNSENDESDDDDIIDKSLTRSRIITQSSDSSDSEHEETKTSPEKPVKDRRKNQNPKKKILPVKTQRVSFDLF